ncbi:MAG: hypothetical protein F4X32_07930 [Candidatus Dadabacteria bacterium]|nr:hypothetical protein [Candidatus Dadabacteria bacterium]
MSNDEIPPKLFVSYSWTTPDHVTWVIQLAEDLCGNGIDVILDKWDLKEGQDSYAFMEQMVTDPEIKKVLLVCDKGYVTKANDRSGGVGTETQIITPEIYRKQDQNKFVAVVTERDEAGNPYIPAFYGPRIFIDFSDPGTHGENFEKLLRWVFDQPLHRKPSIGKKPAFLLEENHTVVLATSSLFRRATEAIQNGRDHSILLVAEYFEKLTAEFEKLRIEQSEEGTFDDLVIQSIESFLPYRNEIIKIFLLLSRNKNTDEAIQVVHGFLEDLIPYMDRPKNTDRWREDGFDNFKFIIHELYLYALSCFIRHEKFDAAAVLIGKDYYLSHSFTEYGSAMVTFRVFRHWLQSLQNRNNRLTLDRPSLHADLLKQRSEKSGIEFRDLMQTDLVLFLRGHLDHPDDRFHWWWPETLLYAERQPRPFEIFAKSQSTRYFNRMKCLLRIDSKTDLTVLLSKIYENPQLYLPRSDFPIDLEHLLGYKQIATKE